MSTCGSSILACGFRATLLDSLGNVANLPNNSYVTDKLLDIGYDPEVEPGSDRTLKSGCDCITATARFPDHLKRFNFEVNLGAFEPALLSLLTGGAVQLSGAAVVGWDYPTGIGCSADPPPKVAIEVWSYNWDYDHQDTVLPYLHYVWPLTQWQIGPARLNTDFKAEVLRGYSVANPLWANGPYSDGPPGGPVGDLGSTWQTADLPPEAACAFASVTPSS